MEITRGLVWSDKEKEQEASRGLQPSSERQSPVTSRVTNELCAAPRMLRTQFRAPQGFGEDKSPPKGTSSMAVRDPHNALEKWALNSSWSFGPQETQTKVLVSLCQR